MPLRSRYFIACYTQDGEPRGYFTIRGTLAWAPSRALWFVSEKSAAEELARLKLETATGWSSYLWCVEELQPQDIGAALPGDTEVDVSGQTTPIVEGRKSAFGAVTAVDRTSAKPVSSASSPRGAKPTNKPKKESAMADAVSGEPVGNAEPRVESPKERKLRELAERAKAKAAAGTSAGAEPLAPVVDIKTKKAAVKAVKVNDDNTNGKTNGDIKPNGKPNVKNVKNAKKESEQVAAKKTATKKATSKMSKKPKALVDKLMKKVEKRKAKLMKKVVGKKAVRKSAVEYACLCGCGEPTVKYFIRGHIAKYNSHLLEIAQGDAKPSTYFSKAEINKLGPWKNTKQGGVRPSHDYTVLRPEV